jgi:hypothetical protein
MTVALFSHVSVANKEVLISHVYFWIVKEASKVSSGRIVYEVLLCASVSIKATALCFYVLFSFVLVCYKFKYKFRNYLIYVYILCSYRINSPLFKVFKDILISEICIFYSDHKLYVQRYMKRMKINQ